MSETLLTVKQVAEVLQVSRRTIYRLCCESCFPTPVKIGNATRFCSSDLDNYIDAIKQQPPRWT